MHDITTARKVDDFSIEMEKVVPETRTTVKYDRKFLESQLVAIQAQKDAFDADRDRELAEVVALLKACDDAGVVAKSEEVKS